MAKSYKQQKTKEKLSKDILDKQSKKRRQFSKELSNNYINFDEENEEEEVYEYSNFRE
jgi:hypothetical protein